MAAGSRVLGVAASHGHRARGRKTAAAGGATSVATHLRSARHGRAWHFRNTWHGRARHFRSTGGGAATSVAAGSALVLADVEDIGVLGLLARVAARNVVPFVELHSWATFDTGGKTAARATTTASRATRGAGGRGSLFRSTGGSGTASRAAASGALVLTDVQDIGVLGLLACVGGGNVKQFVELHSWATFDAGGHAAVITTTTTAGRATSRTTLKEKGNKRGKRKS